MAPLTCIVGRTSPPMLSRFSVKRPYIVVVAVIVALILGGVSLSKMKTDLYP